MSPPPAGPETTSVFKALGSYADRIRENGELVSAAAPAVAAASSSTSTKATAAPAASASASSSSSAAKKNSAKEKAADPAPAGVAEDDGPWETVQSARAKGKQERDKERDADQGSNSRNWRDRPTKDRSGNGSTSKEAGAGPEGEAKKAPAAAASTSAATTGKSKRAPSSAPATRAASDSGKTPSTGASGSASRTTSNAAPVKSAWSIPMKTGLSSPAESTSAGHSKGAAARAQTAPSSPSLNGTTVANSSIGDISASSPNMSTDTHVSSTPPTSAAAKDGDDDSTSWRSRMTPSSVTETPSSNDKLSPAAAAPKAAAPAVPPVAPKAAPPPPTNAWATRQRSLPLAQAATSSEIKSSSSETAKPTGTRLQFGEVSPTLPNGHAQGEEAVKIGGKKKKKDAASVVGGQTVVMDASQWPDVAAAVGSSKAEPKKETKQDVAEQQQQSPDDTSSSSTKKPKWVRVPASELLAAVDEQAAAAAAATEATKRQSRKRGSKQGESSTSPVAKTDGLPGKPRKSDSVPGSKRSEIRLPPNPNAQATKGGFKPTFGSVGPASEADVAAEEGAEAQAGPVVNGTMSAPLSRQTSKTSQSAAAAGVSPNPNSTNSNLSTGAIDSNAPLEQSLRLGAGPLKPHAQQNATAPLPQQPFPGATGGPSLPRPPRGRSSFSGRGGRGGGRGRGGHHDHNNVYTHGYGLGYAAGASGFYGQPQQPMFDPMQAQWYNMQMYGRGPMPPPPQPQTVVPGLNLDPLRFYVLGQIEYYFSMQNLAMDFFLRQQMDTAGWIDIAMIASFNRIKSLTPDVPLVKEMMEVSSLLEVQGDHVRLRGEIKKWILPDAKQSTIPYSEPQPLVTPTANANATLSPQNGPIANDAEALDVETTSIASVSVSVTTGLPDELEVGLDFEDVPADNMPKYQHTPGGVASALMKNANANGHNVSSGASHAPSSTASVNESTKPEGEGEEQSTPGTSIVGEAEDKA